MKLRSGIAAAALLALLTGTAQAAWQEIGTIAYDAPLQKSVIEVGAQKGRFEAIRIEVKNADVEIANLRIVYGNGQVDEIAVREVFKAGTASRRIALNRGDRNIKQVVVNFRANGKAKIVLLGDAVAAPAPAWVKLGCQSVGFLVDHDAIKVGRKDGAFTGLKLIVTGSPVEFYDLRVVYGNGQADTLKVRAVIPPGGETRTIDLAGKARGLDRIDMLYRAIPSFKGKAAICASGRLAP